MILRGGAVAAVVLFALCEQINCLREAQIRKRSENVQYFKSYPNIRKRRDAPENNTPQKEITTYLQCNKIKEEKKIDEKFKKQFVREEHLSFSGKSLQIAWTGKQYEKIVAITSNDANSTLYLSFASGENTFQDITGKLKLTNSAREISIFKHPIDPETIYLVLQLDKMIYISTDGSENYAPVNLNFSISASVGFIFHKNKENFIMAYDMMEKTLHLSTDKGFKWKKICQNVISAKWSQNDEKPDDIFIITNDGVKEVFFDFLLKADPFENVLKKTEDLGKTWKDLKKQVHSFGVEGIFIYASIYVNRNQDRILEVSTDNGLIWNRVRLPTVTPDMFFSIMDLSNDLIFIHVDDPGDTGKGVLYISDATGIIFSESMTNHLFPNYEDITDFYPVRSMQGVFITSQLMDDKGIRTMISYNRGIEWEPIRRPEGAPCQDEMQPCYLQIHNAYSIRRKIPANPPLSVPGAKGIILAHAHVADSLQMSPPDVFVTSDGGHTWHFALKGPHHYQIADHGGLLVAVPADTKTPKIIKFSANAGRCWLEYKFTDEEIVFTGLLTEPSNADSVVALWGYSYNTSIWHTFIFNFTYAVTDECQKKDYEMWIPQGHDSNCTLGRIETNYRVKKEAWCLTGRTLPHNTTSSNCSCTLEDYGCDYGYVKKDEKCVEDSSVKEVINICLRNHRESLVPLGYHKIPGDTCEGGTSLPKAKMIDLNLVCTDQVYLKKDFMKDEELEQIMAMNRSRAHKIGWTIFLVVCVALCTITLVWAGKKLNNKYRNVSFKYSSIKDSDETDFDFKTKGNQRLSLNISLYDDISSDEDNAEKSSESIPSGNCIGDNLRTGFIHPELYNLISSPADKPSPKDEKLILYDSDVELLK